MLTHKEIQNAQPIDRPYKLGDAYGLYVHIMPDGKKYWRMKYRIHNKEKKLAFGVFPEVTLDQAREKTREARQLLAQDIDPSFARKDGRRKAAIHANNTFKAVALEWHENQSERWSRKHHQNVLHKLETDIFPYLGDDPIADIDAPALLHTLKKIEQRDALDTLSRVRQICSQVFIYGIQTGRCNRNPAADLRNGAFKTRKTTHFAAIDPREIPELLAAIEHNDARLFARTRRAIRLSMLTFVRPGELRKAQWSEMDLEAQEWIIPAERMKMRRPHIVHLSRQAVEILKEQEKETGHINTDLVFPSQIKPRQPMSDGTVNVALKKLGFQGRMNAHGFRALARTAIREKLNYAPDIIEAQLAHKAAGPLGEAYARNTFLEQRKMMMQEWADYLDKAAGKCIIVKPDFKRKTA